MELDGSSPRRPRSRWRARPAAPVLWLPLLLTAGIAALATTAASRSASAQTSGPVPGATDVRRIYLSDCAVCHGPDGRGTPRGISLVGLGAASVDYELSTGRMPLVDAGRIDEPGRELQPLPGTLPYPLSYDPSLVPRRHKPAYSRETIAALTEYVTTLVGRGGPPIPRVGPGDMAEGGQLFRLLCAACHAWAGDGGALIRREAPNVHSATPTQIAEAIRVGPSQMPAFGPAALTDAQVDSVVTYVRYLDSPRDRGGNPLWHLGPFAEGAVALAALVGLLAFTRWIGERG